MKILLFCLSIFCSILLPFHSYAGSFFVSTQQEFDNAHDNASANDTIFWKPGTFSDIFMEIDKDRLTIMAEDFGNTIFNGDSRVDITGDYIKLHGVQFLKGDIGTNDIINTRGSYNVFSHINIREYTSYKYLRVREESQYCEIIYCNFENRLNMADQNILSILVDENQPGYHKIQHCSFKNFAGGGNDEGVEPIRIGVSTQAQFISRTLVEYCYFTQCDGDGELISSKASQNVYRFNTFDRNTKAELVLRHGNEAVVYSNFFLNGKGGVRVREGQDHYIYNNYFYRIDDRPIFLQNEDSDPLDNINVAFNTIIECEEVRLGGSGNDQPTNVTFANNIIGYPQQSLFQDQTNNETWIGNIAFGSLGIPLPASGITMVDPKIESNSESFFGIADDSPAINAAVSGYDFLPQFPGMDAVDTEVLFDLMGQDRPVAISEKDVGCNEHPHNVLIQPIATEENTGPHYDTDMATSVSNPIVVVEDLIDINPNPVESQLYITLSSSRQSEIQLEIYNIEGRRLHSRTETIYAGESKLQTDVSHLPTGIYTIHAKSLNPSEIITKIQTIKFIKM